MAPVLAAILPTVLEVIGRAIPDPQAKAQAQLELMKMQQSGELAELQAGVQLATAQLDVNKAEAASGSKWASGWRPLIGYVCGFALAFQYVLAPMLLWAAALGHYDIHPPDIGLDDSLWELVTLMLGMGGWRSLDKIKGRTKG